MIKTTYRQQRRHAVKYKNKRKHQLVKDVTYSMLAGLPVRSDDRAAFTYLPNRGVDKGHKLIYIHKFPISEIFRLTIRPCGVGTDSIGPMHDIVSCEPVSLLSQIIEIHTRKLSKSAILLVPDLWSRVVSRWLQLPFGFDSTAVRLLIEGHQGPSDATRAADPLTIVALTYLLI